MLAENFYLTASDGTGIAVHRWKTENKPRAIIQLSHGMAEFAMRYDRFAQAAAAKNYAVFAADHRGHGETAGSLDELGYLADKNGFERVMEDQYELSLEIGKQYQGTPIFLLGHSFGSFIAQMYIERHGELLSGCILSGTRGPDPAEVLGGLIISKLVALLIGKKTPSPFLEHLSSAATNKRIPGATNPDAWLTRDTEEIEKYSDSPWTGFTCTAGFYQDLLHGLSVIHKPREIAGISPDLPIFLLSGAEDPVGKYGKTVQKLENMYRKAGISHVNMKLYPGGRHEMHNETNREEVTEDIFAWMNSALTKTL